MKGALFLVFFLGGIVVLGSHTPVFSRPLYFAPSGMLQYFTLGYQDFTADLLWLRFLQSADFCSFEKGRPVYEGEELAGGEGRKVLSSECRLGWGYQTAHVITELSPRFRAVYRTAGPVLSVFVGDIEGAERILLKGVKIFPQDWTLSFYLSYLYAVEIKNLQKAKVWSRRAVAYGGPKRLAFWAASDDTPFSHFLDQKEGRPANSPNNPAPQKALRQSAWPPLKGLTPNKPIKQQVLNRLKKLKKHSRTLLTPP